jgi:hypothetical protein
VASINAAYQMPWTVVRMMLFSRIVEKGAVLKRGAITAM